MDKILEPSIAAAKDVKEYYGGGWYEEKIREVASFVAESEKPVAVCMVGVPGRGR